MTLSILCIECHKAECRNLFNVMLGVVILNVVMLSVVMLGVVALTLPNSVSDRGGTNKTNRGGPAPSSQTVGGPY
jgi:hypothetical protein